MRQIHLIVPFSRPENKDKLIEAYRPMGVILHPIYFRNEATCDNGGDFNEWEWMKPNVIPMDSKDCKVMMPGCFKRNYFIQFGNIIDDDYYVTIDDDDMYEPNVFDEIRKMDDDIVIISMKRGHHTPKGVPETRKYPTDTLFAHPNNVQLGCISAQQSFVKGKIFKEHLHNEEFHCWDGELAVHHRESGERIAYRPDLFALFNYYESGRWDDSPKVILECSGRKPNLIHLVMPFYRQENKDKLIEAYRPMDIILHPIMFQDEAEKFGIDGCGDFWTWVNPFIIPMDSSECEVERIECFKRNKFITDHTFSDEDYYVCVDDDDMYELGVFDAIKQMNDDIVIISMKRGHRIPKGVVEPKNYPTNTLLARSDDVMIDFISGQQFFVKGKIFKEHLHNEEFQAWDGELIVHHKESGEQIAYRPDLFALFNYYEPTRWDHNQPKVVFGCMINDPQRFSMVLRQSQINSPLMFIRNPESATKGLNILLDQAEYENADIMVLCHQDVYFRSGWVDQLRSQIKLLPDSWMCAGPIGKDASGLICGKFHDMRIPDHFNTSDIHTFPHEACCFDEAVIVVNMKKGFRFDTALEGFDLYGTLCVLQAWESNQTAWVIDCFCEHYCLRKFTWSPDQSFVDNYKWLHDRFSTKWKLDSTALGLSPDATERLEQIRAFMTSAGPEVAAA